MACALRRHSGKRVSRSSVPGPLSVAGESMVASSVRPRAESLPAGDGEGVPDDIIKLFQHFDLDGNGKIDRSELTQVLQQLDAAYWNTKRIRALFRAADLDRDQCISYHEFLKWAYSDGAEQQAMRHALPSLDAKESAKQQAKVEHGAILARAETAAALVAALEAAETLFKPGELQKHEQRLEQMRLPFPVSVSTLSGLSCTVNVTREQNVKSLCHEVAQKIDKKAYRIMLAHAGGNLQPPTATLEECGVFGSEVQLAASFCEVDPLLELSLTEFLDSVVHHKVASESEVSILRLALRDGKLSEDECRDKFKGGLAVKFAEEEKRQQAIAEKLRREEEERKRKAEEQEMRRKAELERKAAIRAKHRLLYESLAFDEIVARAADAGFVKEVEAVTEDRRADLVHRLSLLDAIKVCQAESLTLREPLPAWESAAQALVSQAMEIRADAEPILEEGLLPFESAMAAIDRLSKKDLVEVQHFKCPPRLFLLTMEAVCKLFLLKPHKMFDPDLPGRKKDDYWTPAIHLLRGSHFLNDLRNYDKDNVPKRAIAQIAAYVEDESCSPERNRTISVLGGALCEWVRAIYKYHFICIEVEPMRERLRRVEEQLCAIQTQIHGQSAKIKQQVDDEDYFKQELNTLGLFQS